MEIIGKNIILKSRVLNFAHKMVAPMHQTGVGESLSKGLHKRMKRIAKEKYERMLAFIEEFGRE